MIQSLLAGRAVGKFNRFVERPNGAETELPIESYRAGVFGRDFQTDSADADLLEAEQSREDHCRGETPSAMEWRDADVLDARPIFLSADGLDRAAILRSALPGASVFGQPGRLGDKAIFAGDLGHQSLAALEFAETRKDLGIDLITKAVVLDLGMSGDQRFVPSDQSIAGRHFKRHNRTALEIKLHSITLDVLKVAKLHGEAAVGWLAGHTDSLNIPHLADLGGARESCRRQVLGVGDSSRSENGKSTGFSSAFMDGIWGIFRHPQ